MNKYEQIASSIGSVGGEPVNAVDVEQEMRSKSYVVDPKGNLQPTEMARLSRAVRRSVAQRLVTQYVEPVKPNPTVAHNRSEPIASGLHSSMASWQRSRRHDIALAKGRPNMSPTAQLAWQEYYRGPMWLR